MSRSPSLVSTPATISTAATTERRGVPYDWDGLADGEEEPAKNMLSVVTRIFVVPPSLEIMDIHVGHTVAGVDGGDEERSAQGGIPVSFKYTLIWVRQHVPLSSSSSINRDRNVKFVVFSSPIRR